VPEAIRLITTVPDAVVEVMRGRHPDATHYDPRWRLGDRDADVYRPDGTLLLALRVGRLLSADLLRALAPLERMAKTTTHRLDAAGANETFRNNVGGWLDGEPTAFTRDRPADWLALRPLLLGMDAVFREFPEQYAVSADAARRTPPELVVPGTPFTTVTANRDATGVHRDRRNLDGAYGLMTAIRSPSFAGGLFVLPAFLVAVDLMPGAVLIVDNREFHGNTPFLSGCRVAAVTYFHSSNLPR
jgi:hypothetical protein